jgi:hypothetical protein
MNYPIATLDISILFEHLPERSQRAIALAAAAALVIAGETALV